MGGKWLELLKEIAPGVTRAAVLRDTANPTGIAQFGVIQTMAPSLRVEVTPVNIRDAHEIERAVAAFARSSNERPSRDAERVGIASSRFDRHACGALIKLPAVYFERAFVAAGGSVSCGANFVDLYRQAASYFDRILRGEKPVRPAGAGTDQTPAR